MNLLLVSCIMLASSLQDVPAIQPVTIVPVPSMEDRAAAAGWLDGRNWRLQHEDCVALAGSSEHDLVLLGDSITQSFGGDGRRTGQVARSILDEVFAGLKIANMGISGDRTQHLLWRLENGCLDGPAPRAYLIAIGTNNIGRDDPLDILAGIEAIVEQIRSRHVDVPIILCPILPRGFTPEDPARQDVDRVNKRLGALQEVPRVHLMDCRDLFVTADGMLRAERYASDGLHLAPAGYRSWGGAIRESYRLVVEAPEEKPGNPQVDQDDKTRERQTEPSG